MIEALQISLYPLGFLSAFFFASRFFVQWLASEKKGVSVVPKVFWQLSFYGNLLLAIHSLFQMQVHVLLIQVMNGLIALRNINFMSEKRWPITKFLIASALSLLSAFFLLFVLSFFQDNSSFFRIPVAPWNRAESGTIHWMWHVSGVLGLLLFNSRFFIQWLSTEREGRSFLGKTFWWTSLAGDILCLAYFMRLGDPVNYIGPIFGLIPYVRNLMLIRKQDVVYET